MKYEIVKIKLSNDDNLSKWTDEKLNMYTNNKDIIGYCMSNETLTLYLLENNKKYEKITLSDLQKIYEYHNKIVTYKNPPLEVWLDTKNQWCKSVAQKLAKKYNRKFDETLSDVYYSIVNCNTKNKYIGNLYYLQTAAENMIRMSFRDKYDDKIISLDTPLEEDLTLEDTIAGYEMISEQEARENYDKVFDKLCKALRTRFSERETNEIIKATTIANGLAPNIYKRFLSWRQQWHLKDFLEDE